MMECIDTVSQETNKLINHQRQVIKQQQAKNQYLQKRVRHFKTFMTFCFFQRQSIGLKGHFIF